jgi:hypothetical protein
MRAIHVANYGTERIYYLVDKEQDHDGVIVRPKQEPVFTDLWSYITRVSGDVGWRKITNTRFHHFFWFGQNGELAKRWRRVFQEHSIEPRKELLLSVPIVTDFPRNEKRKRATEKRSNRAIEFKTLTAAGLHEKALGRRIGRGGSRVARRMMRSADFDPNPIDADLDMLVQEGTLWERPATPGAPHVSGVSGRRMERRARSEGLASERGFASEREPGWDWRSVAKEIDIDPERRMNGTAEQLRTYRLQKFKAVEDHFNDGAPITGRKHAKELEQYKDTIAEQNSAIMSLRSQLNMKSLRVLDVEATMKTNKKEHYALRRECIDLKAEQDNIHGFLDSIVKKRKRDKD